MKRKYLYFVNYEYDDGKRTVSIFWNKKICSHGQLLDVNEHLKQVGRHKEVVIKNYILINSRRRGAVEWKE